MAAPMDSSFVLEHRRNLSSALNASMTKPPEWFADYENRLETRLRGIMNPLEDISKRMETIEGKLRSVDFEIESVKADIKTLQKEKEDLITKVDDLENRSRRDNLIFFGVPEVAEKKKTVQSCLWTCWKTLLVCQISTGITLRGVIEPQLSNPVVVPSQNHA